MDSQRYLELASQSGILDRLAGTGPPHYLVAATYRESHLMQCRLAFYLGQRSKEVELALLGRKELSRLHRHPIRTDPSHSSDNRPKQLIVVDDVIADELVRQLGDVYPKMRDESGVQRILYWAKDQEDRLYTLFIPPEEMSPTSPGNGNGIQLHMPTP